MIVLFEISNVMKVKLDLLTQFMEPSQPISHVMELHL